MQLPSRFNIRVYGLHVDSQNRVLLSDEYRFGHHMTKFPGGGLEKGEGLEQALKREFQEELSVEVCDHKLFYINDFLQISAFDPKDQIISVYYLLQLASPLYKPVSELPFDFPELVEGAQSFRWQSLDQLHPDQLTFPIDKVVAQLLHEKRHEIRNL
ncbi:MAG: NUDIX domain-containing protein [Bacteroidia bacterium]|nr:NUDIX domain-containing protein [Bacteroidia bacterium]